MEKIKVFLSDPQILFREGIHFILSGEEDFEVTGEAADNEEALAAMEANPPAVAILSMKDGRLDGPSVTRRIKRNFPSLSVILVADAENEEQLFLAMKSGASACLTKDVDPDHLVNIIKEIVKGSQPMVEALLIPAVAAKTLAEFEALSALSEHLHGLLAGLTAKETEVLKCIAQGNTLEQVAAKVGGSQEVIRQQLGLIVQKLVADDQAKAMMEAVQRNLPFSGLQAKPGTEYVTRAEFLEFKESLMQSLKTLVGELKLPGKKRNGVS